MRVDFGDLELVAFARIKRFKPPRFVWTVGPVRDTVPEDRVPGPAPTYKQPPGRVDLIVDLQSDKKAEFGFGPVDEMGNPSVFDGTIVFTLDDPSLVTLTDNGDGTGTIAAVGPTGSAVLTGTATPNDGSDPIVGTEAINVVTGDTVGFKFAFGAPTEVTPDAP
jgi:hypothetical protein